MKNIPPLYKFSLKAEGGTNSVNRKCNPLRRSCVSSARNAGESAICPGRAQPSAEIVRVERAKCRRECDLETCFTFGGSLVRSARFGDLPLHFWRKSLSHEALVLETWRFTFGRGLVRSARFGDGALTFKSLRFGDLALHLWSSTQT